MNNKFTYDNLKKVMPNILFMIKYVIKYNKSFIFFKLLIIIAETFTTYVNLNITKWILDTVELKNINETFLNISVIVITLIIFNIFSLFFNNIKYPLLTINLSQKIYEEMLLKIKKIDQIHFDKKEFYDIYTRALREVDGRAESVLNTLCNLVSFIFQSALIITITSFINIEIMIIGLFATLVGALVSYKKNRYIFNQNYENTQNSRERNYIRRITYQPEYLSDLKIYNEYSSLLLSRYDESTGKYKNIVKKYSMKIFILNIVFMVANILFVILLPCFIVMKLLNKGLITIGEATILINSSSILPNKLNRLFGTINELLNHSLYIDNLRQLLEFEVNIENTEGVILNEINNINVKNLSFAYDINADLILNDINLNIEKGKKIAIIGYNGSGKSTLAKLLLRLYDTSSGEITINDTNIKNIDIKSIRNTFSILKQDYKIYSFTVAENIMMKPLSEFTGTDYDIVIDSLKKVNLYEKIIQNKNGIFTSITREFNDDGIYLSGGEMQKMAIARAIAMKSDCIILDEPDSSLDPINQHEIFKIIFDELKDKTLIIISHKMSLVQRSDYIFFLSDHIVKEHGTHADLIALKGEYYNFYKTQADSWQSV